MGSIGYYQEHFNEAQCWVATDLHFYTPPIPFYRVYTGGQQRRFMLATPRFRCHWGEHLTRLEGVRILRNPNTVAQDDMPIAPITSADIEQFKKQNSAQSRPDSSSQYWASFFANKLLHSSTHFLYQAEWHIAAMATQEDNRWRYFAQSILARDLQSLDYDFDWGGFPEDGMVTLASLPAEHSGRVKWWRKKIREHCCPPLLLWWQPHIQAFVLVDGHARLRAYQLEKLQPSCLAIWSSKNVACGYAINHPERIKERLKILGGIKTSLDNGNKPPSTESLNSIMMTLYAEHDYEQFTLTPKVISHLDAIIEQDLLALSNDERVDQDFLQLLLSDERG